LSITKRTPGTVIDVSAMLVAKITLRVFVMTSPPVRKTRISAIKLPQRNLVWARKGILRLFACRSRCTAVDSRYAIFKTRLPEAFAEKVLQLLSICFTRPRRKPRSKSTLTLRSWTSSMTTQLYSVKAGSLNISCNNIPSVRNLILLFFPTLSSKRTAHLFGDTTGQRDSSDTTGLSNSDTSISPARIRTWFSRSALRMLAACGQIGRLWRTCSNLFWRAFGGLCGLLRPFPYSCDSSLRTLSSRASLDAVFCDSAIWRFLNFGFSVFCDLSRRCFFVLDCVLRASAICKFLYTGFSASCRFLYIDAGGLSLCAFLLVTSFSSLLRFCPCDAAASLFALILSFAKLSTSGSLFGQLPSNFLVPRTSCAAPTVDLNLDLDLITNRAPPLPIHPENGQTWLTKSCLSGPRSRTRVCTEDHAEPLSVASSVYKEVSLSLLLSLPFSRLA
ncbi:ATP-dependent RNA helicase, partial [Aureobasidium melanogenum]